MFLTVIHRASMALLLPLVPNPPHPLSISVTSSIHPRHTGFAPITFDLCQLKSQNLSSFAPVSVKSHPNSLYPGPTARLPPRALPRPYNRRRNFSLASHIPVVFFPGYSYTPQPQVILIVTFTLFIVLVSSQLASFLLVKSDIRLMPIWPLLLAQAAQTCARALDPDAVSL